ncbi:DUF3455 domain-containing protein [Lentzea flaviverrucosa]|uniref:Tat (Twin-arginine translocation) pathway signal sequence n=1 Tax=Lentzea flaviverrucosa TaxID=200379 RepID=A0A1H9Q800_9PSEU|nr:DUF3455 domain-containing protein [Lentzea flaviverrucosa]RDI29601.1 uncharacterized protein DUF3455 [Lentzea flaviverrucosa]SER56528.1 Protein of unknown function [Lentzea flaviverrucosa]
MKRAGIVLVSSTLLGILLGGAGSTAAPTPEAMNGADARVAPAVQVPSGNKLVAKLYAKGVQTYTCTAGAWKGLEPAATLADRLGRAVGLHSRGPVWVSTVDGSAVEAAPVEGARNEVSGAVPELLLKAKSTRGEGTFAGASYVQRLATKGGVAPAGGCTEGAQTSVRYEALYTFSVPAL